MSLNNAKVNRQQGAARLVVESGGEIDVETGGALKVAGVDKTAALAAALANPAVGVAAGYKIARGTLTPTNATETVVTGLATVVAAVAGFKGAPTLTHMFVEADIGDQAGSPAAGSILVRSKKPTGAADVTPLPATTPWSAVDWVAVGQ